MSLQELPHMLICGALRLTEGPPLGSHRRCTSLTFPSLRLDPRPPDHCPVLPPMPFRFPDSFREQQNLLLPASGRMLLWGGRGAHPWVQDLSSILIQTTIPDLCTSRELSRWKWSWKTHLPPHPPHSSTARYGRRTCIRSCLFGLGGGGRVEVYLRISFEKEKVRFSPSRRVSK